MDLGPFDEEGLLAGAVQVPSPNCDERPEDAAVRLLVVHNISLPPGQFGGEAIVQLFTNTLDFSAHPYYEAIRDLKVSAHFLVRRGGELIQLVPCTKRAWHAGPSSWWGRERCTRPRPSLLRSTIRTPGGTSRGSAPEISDRRCRRARRHCARPQDRPRAGVRLGTPPGVARPDSVVRYIPAALPR